MTVFIQKGDSPLSVRQATKRGLKYFESEKAQWEREMESLLNPEGYNQWALGWVEDNKINAENNKFNHQLAAYRKATSRLNEYLLSEGREEVTEEQPTGEFDQDGNPITTTVVVSPAIDPLPLEVEQPVYNEEGVQTGTEMVKNPLIVKDEQERTSAQMVVDNTPEEVKSYEP